VWYPRLWRRSTINLVPSGSRDLHRKVFVFEMKRVGGLVTALGLGTLFAASCAAERPYVWAQSLPVTVDASTGDNEIHARDTLAVAVRDQVALSGEFVVRDDGGYLHPMLGNVMVSGRTPADVQRELRARLATLVVTPQVTVSIAKVAPIRVSVIGEVRTPGPYELNRDRSVVAALAAAGWVTDYASRDRIFVIRKGQEASRIRFRTSDVTSADGARSPFRLHDADLVVVE
jgi:polysaccharide biosynthesis/export protein